VKVPPAQWSCSQKGSSNPVRDLDEGLEAKSSPPALMGCKN